MVPLFTSAWLKAHALAFAKGTAIARAQQAVHDGLQNGFHKERFVVKHHPSRVLAHQDDPAWFRGKIVRIVVPIPGTDDETELCWVTVSGVSKKTGVLIGTMKSAPTRIDVRRGEAVVFHVRQIEDLLTIDDTKKKRR